MPKLSKVREKILLFLYDGREVKASGMSESDMVDRDISTLRDSPLPGLVEEGLIESEKLGEDERGKEEFQITEEGKKVLEKHIRKDIEDLKKRFDVEGEFL